MKRKIGVYPVYFLRHAIIADRCVWEIDGKLFSRFMGHDYPVHMDDMFGYVSDEYFPMEKRAAKRRYNVFYRMPGAKVQETSVIAANAYEAWREVAYTARDGEYPYSAWVDSVVYSDGRVHYYNTSEGNPY